VSSSGALTATAIFTTLPSNPTPARMPVRVVKPNP
jgi:hypothetical protein